MATKKKTNKKLGKGGKIALGAFAFLLLLIFVLIGIGFINANLVRIRKAEVVLPDLPNNFDGVTLLYAADIDLCGLNTPARSGELFRQLQSLNPDMLILGGDYTSTALLDKLNRSVRTSIDEAKAIEARSDFFHYISSFKTPLGKFAIASTEDIQWQNLKLVLEENDIQPLFNEKINITSGRDSLWLVGISGQPTNLNDSGNAFSRNDCVIVIAEGPDALPILLTSEARDGGSWVDMILCGHTHGGQVKLFGRTLLTQSDAEKRIDTSWNILSNLPILNTEGVGCEGLNLRLGTEPEVWLITLRRE